MKLMYRNNAFFIYLLLSALVVSIFCIDVKAQTPAQDCEKLTGEAAIIACDNAISLNPQSYQLLTSRSIAWSEKGDYVRAIHDLNNAIILNHEYGLAFALRGNAWLNKGDKDHALVDFNEAIRLNPETFINYVSRGAIFFLNGDNNRVILDFNEAIFCNAC